MDNLPYSLCVGNMHLCDETPCSHGRKTQFKGIRLQLLETFRIMIKSPPHNFILFYTHEVTPQPVNLQHG